MFEAMGPEFIGIPAILVTLIQWGVNTWFIFILHRRNNWKTLLPVSLAALAVFLSVRLLDPVGVRMAYGNVPFWLRLADYIPSLLLCFLYWRLVSGISSKDAAFCSGKIVTISELIASIACTGYSLYYGSIGRSMPALGLCFFISFVLIAIVIYRLEIKYDRAAPTGSPTKKQIVLTYLVLFFAAVPTSMAYSDQNLSIDVGMQSLYYLFRMLIYLLATIVIYYVEISRAEQKEKDELTAIQSVLREQYHQYLEFKEVSEYLKLQVHDFKHHIQVIRQAYTDEEREQYLSEMENSIHLYQAWEVSGNLVLDTILTQKKIYCTNHGIELTCMADGKLLSQLRTQDICTIFGNLLDNSVEAVSRLEDSGERLVHLEVSRKLDFLVIRVENRYDGTPVDVRDIPQTTKADREKHGYGMKSVRYVVEQYGGELSMEAEDGWFTVNIMIPINLSAKEPAI